MAKELTAEIFYEKGVHIIRLGNLGRINDGYNITVAKQPEGTLRGFGLKKEHFDLVASLDPTVTDREFSPMEQALLLTLARENALAFVKDDDDLAGFNMVPCSRETITLVEALEDGFRLRVNEGELFTISEMGYRFVPLIERNRSVGEIAAIVKQNMLSDPDDREIIDAAVQDQGRSFDSFLAEEAFFFIREMTNSGALTFEPRA